MADRLLAGEEAGIPEQVGDQRRGDREERQIEPQLLVASDGAGTAAHERAVEESEVDPSDHHEESQDPLRGGGEDLGRPRVGAKPARRQGRECVRDSLVEVHAGIDTRPAEDREDGREDGGQRDVEEPQPPGGVADRRRQRVDVRPGRLGLHQLAPADPQAGQDREREHDDAHASDPLAELAPEHERAVDGVVLDQDGRAGSRHPRHRLEERVDRMVELHFAREDVGHRDCGGAEEPRERDDEEPFADADVLAPLRQRADRHSGAGGDHGRSKERHGGLRVQDRDDRGEGEREREVAKERPDEIERRAHVDVHTHAAAKTRPLHVERRLVGEPDYEAPRGEPEEGLEPTTYRLQGGCSTS